MTVSETLRYLSPELILLIAAAVVFSVDLVMRREPEGRRATLLPKLALVGLGLALIATLAIAPGVKDPVATTMAVDPMAIAFKVIAIAGVALVTLSAVDYIPGRTRYVGEFYALLVTAALAIGVMVSANDLILVYLGVEFLSITSYILTGFLRQDQRSTEAALKYFLYGAAASAVMLYGMSLIYGSTGSTDITRIAAAIAAGEAVGGDLLAFPAVVLLIVGFGFKASLVPFHQWAPDAYEGAPTPVTAFLSTASKAAGFAVMTRVLAAGLAAFQSLHWVPVLSAVAIVTMTLGNLVAIQQRNMKRLLAYSSIAQAGYIVIGLIAWSQDAVFGGVNGLLVYLLAYLFTNVGAFLVVIAIENATGSVDLSDYAGLVSRSPLLAVTMLIFMLSLAGIPPTGGFLGKFLVFGAALRSQLLIVAIAAIINSAIAAFYYLNVVRHMFLMPAPNPEAEHPIRISPALVTGLWVCAVLTLVMGVYAQPFIRWGSESAAFLAAMP